MAWAPVYATVQQLQEFTRIPDDADDSQCSIALATSARTIDQRCRRQFGQDDAPVTRYYRWGTIDDLMVADDVVVAVGGNVMDADDYYFAPRNAPADGMPWTELCWWDAFGDDQDDIAITARWGWTAIPDPIVEATLLQASRVLSRRDSPYGVAGSPTVGSEMRLLAKLDPDVLVAVEPYRRRARPQ